MTPSENSKSVKSAETAFIIIQGIRDLDGARVSEVAAHLDIPKSTAHRYLTTLLDLEYLSKQGDTYYIGHRFLDLGEYTRTRREEYNLARGTVEELADETEERTQFIVEEHGMGVYLYRETGEHAVRAASRIGKRVHMHSTAAGKAILSQLPESRVEAIIDHRGLEALTDNTITDRATLFEELERIREQGYSSAKEENTERLWAFGVPVMDATDRVLGAVSVSGPTNRLTQTGYEMEVMELLQGSVNELELNIAYL